MSIVSTCKRIIRPTSLCLINFFYQADWYICKYNLSCFDIQTLNPQDSSISFQMCQSSIMLQSVQSVWVPNLYLHHDYLQGFQNQDAMPNICPMSYHDFVFFQIFVLWFPSSLFSFSRSFSMPTSNVLVLCHLLPSEHLLDLASCQVITHHLCH